MQDFTFVLTKFQKVPVGPFLHLSRSVWMAAFSLDFIDSSIQFGFICKLSEHAHF